MIQWCCRIIERFLGVMEVMMVSRGEWSLSIPLLRAGRSAQEALLTPRGSISKPYKGKGVRCSSVIV